MEFVRYVRIATRTCLVILCTRSDPALTSGDLRCGVNKVLHVVIFVVAAVEAAVCRVLIVVQLGQIISGTVMLVVDDAFDPECI